MAPTDAEIKRRRSLREYYALSTEQGQLVDALIREDDRTPAGQTSPRMERLIQRIDALEVRINLAFNAARQRV